jgi:hypothetical protein
MERVTLKVEEKCPCVNNVTKEIHSKELLKKIFLRLTLQVVIGSLWFQLSLMRHVARFLWHVLESRSYEHAVSRR